ncbi:hypothetical protein BDU57DRAFT_513836 [Ampelomyces quisqualis]|uniref:Uncharacterized protein n=1 Tax=Ampelomyces quisqualis TaxID=50730 RepID=A0A6A5QQ97_AMPQU|nr:hypothetical protein BDU57DRAFT_513836 [Ampelomyces quisqualis]
MQATYHGPGLLRPVRPSALLQPHPGSSPAIIPSARCGESWTFAMIIAAACAVLLHASHCGECAAGGPSHVKVVPPRRSPTARSKHDASRGRHPTSEGVPRDGLFRPLPRLQMPAAALVGVIQPHLTPGRVEDMIRGLEPQRRLGRSVQDATTELPACARDTLKLERANLSVDVRCGSDGSCTTVLERGCFVIG